MHSQNRGGQRVSLKSGCCFEVFFGDKGCWRYCRIEIKYYLCIHVL
ncbi:DUF5348 domain-containing protein [Porphyromonas circumdentaria]